MSTKNKKSVASQALLEMDAITSAIKEESKNTLNTLLAEAVRNALREGCEEEEDKEYDVVDDEQNDADDKEDDSTDTAKSDVDEDGNETVEFKDYDLGFLTMHSSASMKNLMIKSMYTTSNEDSSNKGAMTFTCEVDGKTVYVRTAVLRDADGNLLTADDFRDKNIDVKGIVDFYDGDYQIKVFTVNNITVNN